MVRAGKVTILADCSMDSDLFRGLYPIDTESSMHLEDSLDIK